MDERVKIAITKKAQLVDIPSLGIHIPKPRFAMHPSQRFKRLGTGVLAAVGFVAIARTADIIIAWLQQRQIKAQSSEYYAKMLEAHPALRKEKPEVVARYWASLYHFAPHMAQDPLAAGSFIRQSLARGLPEEFGGPAPDTYLALTDINRKVQQAQSPSDLSTVSTDIYKGVGSQLIQGMFDNKGLF